MRCSSRFPKRDSRDDRREIRSPRWPGGEALVILDELHKWRGWKGWIKGEYDKHRGRLSFLPRAYRSSAMIT